MDQLPPGASAYTKSEAALKLLLYAYASFLFLLIVVDVTFTDRPTIGDECGLYNASYMYEHYGKVTYPMQLQFDSMTVHPPLHYFIIGLLMKCGFQVFYAAALPLVVLAFIAFAAAVTSRLSIKSVFALLTGFTLATLAYTSLVTIRPDMHVAFAWFCGLVLLESARLLNWDAKRLFAGSFFIAYASGLHYWAAAAALVLPAYALYIFIRPAGVRSWSKLIPIASGALLFYIPYAVFFLIPDFHGILIELKAANATGGGIAAAIRSHFLQLTAMAGAVWPPILAKLLYFPVKSLKIPPLACALPVLLCSKSLRGLALPAAILPAFVLLVVSRKAGLFYISPELILYCVAISLVFFHALDFGWRRLRLGFPAVPYVLASALFALVLVRSAPPAKWGVTLKLVDWDVARAANQKMLGDNALAAINQCYAWYTCGAGKLYWIITHINSDYLERVDRAHHFDSVVILNDWFANQHKGIPFPEFYLSGTLNLRGFYFPARYRPELQFPGATAVLHMSLQKQTSIQGFGYDRDKRILNYYMEDPSGSWIFVAFKAHLSSPTDYPEDAVYFEQFLMEQPVGNEPALVALVTARENWLRDRARYAKLGTIRDEVPLRMREMNAAAVVASLKDQPIKFMTNQPDLP